MFQRMWCMVFVSACLAVSIGCRRTPAPTGANSPSLSSDQKVFLTFPPSAPVPDVNDLPFTAPQYNAVVGETIHVEGIIEPTSVDKSASKVVATILFERSGAKPVIMGYTNIPVGDSGRYGGNLTLPPIAGSYAIHVADDNDWYVGRSRALIHEDSPRGETK